MMTINQKISYHQIVFIATIAIQSFTVGNAFINIAKDGAVVDYPPYTSSSKCTKPKNVILFSSLQNSSAIASSSSSSSSYEVINSNHNILDIDEGEISSDVDVDVDSDVDFVDTVDVDVDGAVGLSLGLTTKKRRRRLLSLSSLTKQYSQFTKDYYLSAAFIQSSVIAFMADLATQKMASPVVSSAMQYNYGHALAIASVAATASGSINAYFLRKLEQTFPGKRFKNVSIKTLISTLLLGGAINAAYIIGVPLFTNTIYASSQTRKLLAAARLPTTTTMDVLLQGWTNQKFITLTKVECIMFLPYHLLAFQLVPSQLRPLTQAGMAGIFNVIVSAVTLGYFSM